MPTRSRISRAEFFHVLSSFYNTGEQLLYASKNEDVLQASANVILDRAYGRPSQVASDDEDNPLELLMQHLEGKSRGLPSQRR